MAKRITIVMTVEDEESKRLPEHLRKVGLDVLKAFRVRPAHTTYSIVVEDWHPTS